MRVAVGARVSSRSEAFPTCVGRGQRAFVSPFRLPEDSVDEVDIVGTFDSGDTSSAVARALNRWMGWVLEGDIEDVPELFEDFGVATDDYALDRDTDIDWPEPPAIRSRGANVVITVETSETLDVLQELLESLGAFEVTISEDSEDDDDD